MTALAKHADAPADDYATAQALFREQMELFNEQAKRHGLQPVSTAALFAVAELLLCADSPASAAAQLRYLASEIDRIPSQKSGRA